jgi:hypothetical protein
MSWPFLVPILITAIITFGIVLDNWIKMRHGYPVDGKHANLPDRDSAAARHIELLSGENDRLRGQVGRLEERIAVLERIATDPAERTAREIDELR